MKKFLSVIVCVMITFFSIGYVPDNDNVVLAADVYFEGSGTMEDPFLITNKDNFNQFANLVNTPNANDNYKKAYYVQTADIDLGGKSWVPIGAYWNGKDWNSSDTEAQVFMGNYNGNGHSVKGVNVSAGHMYAGLFGRIGFNGSAATIANLHVEGIVEPSFSVANSTIAGGIVSEVGQGSVVINCSFKGTVSGVNADGIIGGVVGKIYGWGSVINCYFNGTIKNSNSHSTSGVVGRIDISAGESYINNCYATGVLNTDDLSVADGVCRIATVDNGKFEIKKCFYNLNNDIAATTGLEVSTSEVMWVSEDELKSEGIISLGLGDAYLLDTENANDGFPVLLSQTYRLSGNGSKNNPYQISSDEDLRFLSKAVNSGFGKKCYFLQTSDIDLQNEPIVAIGTYTESNYWPIIEGFNGFYDGNYHTIYNLNISESYKGYTGVFGWIYGENAGVANLIVNGNINCIDSDHIGGIVGELGSNSSVVNCAFIGTIMGQEQVGGISGAIWQGAKIENCYVNAEITGISKVGGLVGRINRSEDNVNINQLQSNYTTGIINCNSVETIGGIVGCKEERITNGFLNTDNNYYLASMCSGAANGSSYTGCVNLSETALKSCADMLGSPFIDNNSSSLNEGYPVFEWQIAPESFDGLGTLKNPYKIKTADDLRRMAKLINSTYFGDEFRSASYIQVNNIDLNGEQWNPIGTGSYEGAFLGTYDGNKHTIRGLYVDETDHYSGLFNTIKEEAVIKNLVVYGSVTSSKNYTGGIVGEIGYGGSVNDCAFIGNVVGTFNVGGIAGKVYDSGAILNCYHIGDVTGTENTGGIAGMVHTSNGNGTAILKNCYQVGKVTDERNKAGGIVGLAEYDESTGNVISIKNCYYLKTSATVGVNGKSVVDDCTALPENLLKKVAEDLGAFYIINPCASVVNGYPCFEWQIKGDVNADGKVTVADAVMLQKWLLCAGSLTDWQEADLYEDGRIDVFDLVLMKRILISKGD